MLKKYVKMIQDLISSKKWISLLVLLLIPCAYVYFYVGAYEDVDKNTKNFRVGVVVLDKTYHDNNFGQKFKNNLKANKDVKFEFFDNENTARNNLSKYDNIYEYIKIPRDFTHKIIDIKETLNPQDLEFEIVQNPQKNGFSDTITNQLKNKIKEEFNKVFIKSIVEVIKTKSDDVFYKKNQINDGVNKLVLGFEQLNQSLLTAKNEISTKENSFQVLIKNFENSLVYKNLPNVNNYLGYINKYLDEVTSTHELISIQSLNDLNKLFNNFDFFDVNLKKELSNTFSQINLLHNKFIELISKQKRSEENDNNVKLALIDIKQQIENIKTDFDARISNSKILSLEQKNKVLTFTNKLDQVKSLFEQIINSSLNVYEDTKTLNNNLLSFVQKGHINNLLEFLQINPQVINKIQNTLDVKNINSLINIFNEDVSNIIGNAQTNLNKSQHVQLLINKIFDHVDLLSLKEQPEVTVNSIIHPITITRTDLNSKPKFGAIFLPLTLAIGIWFILIFYFSGSQKQFAYQKDFVAKYLFNLTISMLLTLFSSLLVLLIARSYHIIIYNHFMFVICCLMFGFSIFNLFMFLYNFLYNYAKYILTMIMVINICASGATYVVGTINPQLSFFNNWTHFKYLINSLRELLSSDINYSLINHNLFILAIMGVVFGSLNLVFKYISIKKILLKMSS